MKIEGDYQNDGYASVKQIVPDVVARAIVHRLREDLRESGLQFNNFTATSKLLNKPAIEIHGARYKPMTTFHWGLTPAISEAIGLDLLPSYCFFRIYQGGDICRVHSDRGACEHSLTLTLAYADDIPWEFNVGKEEIDAAKPFAESFDSEPFVTIAMRPGDAVLYQGPRYRHGRVKPNPNRWSAHMFLHWVDRKGPHSANAFEDVGAIPDKIRFD